MDGKYSPSAVCGDYIVVANSNLRVYVRHPVTGIWSLNTTVGNTGMFDMNRAARNVEWGCSGNAGSSSYIVANSGGPNPAARGAGYRPRIFVFKQDGAAFSLFTTLNLDTWTLPLTYVKSTTPVTLWQTTNPALATADDATSPAAFLFTSALERISVHRSFVASVAAFYPEYGEEEEFPGKPLFLWDVDNTNTLVTTEDDRACMSSTARHTANMPLAVVDMDGLAQPAIFVGCPGTQLQDDAPPYVEMWVRVSTRGCNGPEDQLQRLSNLFPAAATSTFPGFSPLNTMADQGRFDTITSPNGAGPGYDLDNIAPGVALVAGSEGGSTTNPDFVLVIGDPGYDSDTTDDLDTGRAFYVRVTRPVSATSTTTNMGWSATVEKTFVPPGAQQGEMFGGNRITAAREAAADIIAVGSPRQSAPTVRVASSSRSVAQVSTASASTAGLAAFSAGASIDATGRWLASTDLGGVAVFTDADSPHGFATTVSTTAESKPEFHSTVHAGQSPYDGGALPSGSGATGFIGHPLVKFLPAYAAYDGRPSLIVVGPTAVATAPAIRELSPRLWQVSMYKLRAKSSAPANLDVATANASLVEWYRASTMALPAGYSACSHLYDRCQDNPSGDNCVSFVDKPCANRIEVLALPGNISTSQPRDALLQRQLGTLDASSTPETLPPSRSTSLPLGTGSGLPGCLDGVTLALPDAGQSPGAVMVCVRNHLSSAPVGSALQLNNQVLPSAGSTDGRLRVGQACTSQGVVGCLNTAGRTAKLPSAAAFAGTKIASGHMLGKVWLGVTNDLQNLELFQFQERSGTFVPFSANTAGVTPAEVHPIQCDYRQDTVILSHLNTVLSGSGGESMDKVQSYHLYMDSTLAVPKVRQGASIGRPSEVSAVDVCGYGVFGSAIVADHTMLSEEGHVAIMSTGGSAQLTSCTDTQNSFISGTPVMLSLYSVRSDPLLVAALHDNGHDYIASSTTTALQHRSDETAESPRVSGADVSPSLSRPASVLARRSTVITTVDTAVDYIHTYTLSSSDAYYPQAEFSTSPVPTTIVGPRGLGMRTHAYAVVRTAESAYPWALARSYSTDAASFTERRSFFGASTPTSQFIMDPVAVLRAGAGMPRIYMQVAAGVLQIDRRVVAVSSSSLGGNAKSGALLQPLAGLEVAVQQACSQVDALCAPVVLIGQGPSASESAAYSPAAMRLTTPIVAYDAQVMGASLTNTITYNAPRVNGRWEEFNVTIHGAGIDKTRIVFDLNNDNGTSATYNSNPFRVAGLTLKDLTLDGGTRIHAASSAGTAVGMNDDGGVISIGAAGAIRASLRLQRVRVAHGQTGLNGGLISATNADVVIADSLLSDGQADEAGGLVNLASASHAAFVRTTLSSGSTLARDGGCVYASGASIVAVDQSFFTACVSGSAGGGVGLNSGHLRMLRSELYQNEALVSGGGLEASFGRAIVWQSAFTRNTVKGGDGGAVRVSQSAARSTGAPKLSLFLDCTFLANSGGNGGGMSVASQSEVVTHRCGFAYCQANTNGGAVAVQGSSKFYDGGSVFHGSQAFASGGGLSFGSGSSGSLIGTALQANGAQTSGGGVYCNAAQFNSDTSDPVIRQDASNYVETASDLRSRGVSSLSDVDGIDVASNKAPRGAGVSSLTCSGSLRRPLVRLNTILTPFRGDGAVFEYVTFVSPDTDTRTSPRGAGTVDHIVSSAYSKVLQVATGTRPSVGAASAVLPTGSFTVTASTTSVPFTRTSVFQSDARLDALPSGTLDTALPKTTQDIAAAQTGQTQTDLEVSSSLALGGGLYASGLSTAASSLILNGARFRNNTARDGSGGCIYAAGDPADQSCVGRAAECYNLQTAAVLDDYLALETRIELTGCEASVGPGIFWTQKPFVGVVEVATSAGQGLFVPTHGGGPPTTGGAGGISIDTAVTDSKYFGSTSSSSVRVPAVEATPSQLKLLSTTPLNATAEPGGAIADNSLSGIAVQLVDPYGNTGSPLVFKSYTVTAAVTSDTLRLASLEGSTTQSYSAVHNAAFFDDLRVKAAAGDALKVQFTLTSSTGINGLEPSLAMADRCTGRQQLSAALPQTCEDCPALQRSDGLRCLSCEAGQILDTVTSARGTCVNCTSGTFVSNNVCEPCAVGRSSPSPVLPTCELCTVGRFSPTTGKSSCSNCAAGFSSSTDRSTCDRCSDDAIAPEGSPLGCQTCLPGTIPAANKSLCLPCAAGTVPLTGAGICTSCTSSQYAPAGSSSCLTCDPGHVPAANKSACVQCSDGSVPVNGQCEACSAGTVAAAGEATCSSCGVGTEADARQSACQNCTAGFASGNNGACSACSAGRYQPDPGQSDCLQCEPGTFSTAGSKECTPCEGNSFTSAFGASACTACATNEVAISGKTACGTCSAGTRPVTGSDGVLACQLCPAGQTSADGSDCVKCDIGTIPNAERTACLTCPATGVVCTGVTMSVDPAFWWSPGALEVGVDAGGDPWAYLPETTVMHSCPSAAACNVSLNDVLDDARNAAASFAVSLPEAQRPGAMRSFLNDRLNSTPADTVACAVGHEGPRCALCEEGYSAGAGATQCTECLDSGVNWLIVLAGLIIVTGAATFLVNNSYRANIKNKAGSNVTPGLIRIITNYLKMQATLGDFKSQAPALIQSIRQGASTVSSGVPVDVGPVACAFSLNYERQLLGVVLMPLVIICAVTVVCVSLYLRAVYCPACLACCSKREGAAVQASGTATGPPSASTAMASRSAAKTAPPAETPAISPRKPLAPSPSGPAASRGARRRSGGSEAAAAEAAIAKAAAEGTSVEARARPVVRRKYLRFCQSAITILLFLVYSMLVKQVFTSWSLYPFAIDGQRYLLADFSVTTTSDAYGRITIMAIVGVALWVVGIPALAIYLLYTNRDRLLDDDFASAFSFLYAGYNIGTARVVNAETIAQARSIVKHLESLTASELAAIGVSKRRISGREEDHDDDGSTRPAKQSGSGVALSIEDIEEIEGEGDDSVPADREADAKDDDEDDAAAPASDSVQHRRNPFSGGRPKAGAAVASAKPSSRPEAKGMEPSPSFVRHTAKRESVKARSANVAFLKTIVDDFENTTVKHDRVSWWFWEVVVLARLVLVTIVAVFVQDVFVQSYAALAIVIAAMVAHLSAHPYSDSVLNFAETLGLLTVLVTQLGSLLWSLDSSTTTIDDTAVTIILIVINILALVLFFIMLVLSVIGAKRIRSIPYCGPACERAYYHERDLRAQYNAAKKRQDILALAHSSDPKLREVGQSQQPRSIKAAAIVGGAAAVGAAAAAGGFMSNIGQ